MRRFHNPTISDQSWFLEQTRKRQTCSAKLVWFPPPDWGDLSASTRLISESSSSKFFTLKSVKQNCPEGPARGESEVEPTPTLTPPAQLFSRPHLPFFCVNKHRCGPETERTGVPVGIRHQYAVGLSRFCVPLVQLPGSFPEKIHRNPFDTPQPPKNKHTHNVRGGNQLLLGP